MEVAGEGVDSPRRSREGYSKDVVYSVNVRGQGTVSSSWMAYPRNGEARGPAGSWPLQGTVAMVRKGVKVFGGEVHSEGSQRERWLRIWVNASSKEKIFLKKASPSEEPSLISPPLTYGIPPSLAAAQRDTQASRAVRPGLCFPVLNYIVASNEVLCLLRPQFPQLGRSRLSRKDPPSANAT